MFDKLIWEYLEEIPFKEFEGIKFKVIDSQDALKLGFNPNRCPKIKSTDPLIKNLLVKLNDVIAIYRDYELNVSPYYYYRMVS